MIEVKAIDHVVLRTSNIKAMLKFYSEVLNCTLERELKELGLVQLRAGSALIDLVPVDSELGRMRGGAPRQDGRNMDHLCLQISELKESELLSHLQRNGIETEEFAERYGAEGFGRSTYIHDPEGNVIELKIPNQDLR